MFVSAPVIAKLVDVISVNALSISTFAFATILVLNIFVTYLDSNTFACELTVTLFEVLFVVNCIPAPKCAFD